MRVFYLAPVASPLHERPVGRSMYIGAADRKVLGVCSALRSAGLRPVILTSKAFPPGGGPRAYRLQGIGFIFLPTIGIKLINRVSAALFAAWFLMIHGQKSDRVIFYNYYPELIFVAAACKLKDVPFLVDIEDAPHRHDFSILGLASRAALPLLLRLAKGKALAVSQQVARLLRLRDYEVVYGCVVPKFRVRPINGAELHVLYSGTLNESTGTSLFLSAVAELSARSDLSRRVVFHVSGRHVPKELSSLASQRLGAVRVNVYEALPTAEYERLLTICEVGLSLRVESHGVANTTFPSKVVEIAAHGLVLVSTKVSDLEHLFGGDAAVLLHSAIPKDLADCLAEIASHPARYQVVAAKGMSVVEKHFSPTEVGRRMRKFLLEP